MTLDANKNVVRRYVEAACRKDLPAMRRELTEDVRYWIAGGTPLAGKKTRDEFIAEHVFVFDRIEGPAQLTIHTLTAEEDRVSVTLRGAMTLKDGRPYHNRYHVLATVLGDRITGWEEYHDTALVTHLLSTYPQEQSMP